MTSKLLVCTLLLTSTSRAIELRKDVVGSFGTANGCAPDMLRGHVYNLVPDTLSLPKLEELKPVGVVCSYWLNIPTRSFLEGIPGVTTRIEWFAIDYEGDFWVETPGSYMFTLASDDGSRLYIDGKSIIDNDGVHAVQELGGRAKLEPGKHHIRVSYFQGPREYVALVLKIAPPHGIFEIFDMRSYRPRATAKATRTVAADFGAALANDARPVLRRSAEAHDPLAAKAYELPALAALASASIANAKPLRDFDAFAGAFRFRRAEAGRASTQFAIAMQVPAAGLTATPVENQGVRLHLVVLALVKDAQGNVVRKFSEDFPVALTPDRMAALKTASLSWHRVLSLEPGLYTIEAVAVDREANRASVAGSIRIDNRATAASVGLSDLMLVERIEPVAGASVEADPFEYDGKRVVPVLSGVTPASAHPYIYFVVYPAPGSQAKPKISFELTHDGQPAGRQVSELPQPDAKGEVPVTIAAPMKAGKNRLRIVVEQGAESVERSIEYTIPAQ